MTAIEQQIARESAMATAYAALPEPAPQQPRYAEATMLCNTGIFETFATEIADYEYLHALDYGEQTQVEMFESLNEIPRNVHINGKHYYFLTYLGGRQRVIATFPRASLEAAVRFADAFNHYFLRYRTKRRLRWNFVTGRGAKDCENEPQLLNLLTRLEAAFLEHGVIKRRGPKPRTVREIVTVQNDEVLTKLNKVVAGQAAGQLVDREHYRLIEQMKYSILALSDRIKHLEDRPAIAAVTAPPPVEEQPAPPVVADDEDVTAPITLSKITVTPIFGNAAD